MTKPALRHDLQFITRLPTGWWVRFIRGTSSPSRGKRNQTVISKHFAFGQYIVVIWIQARPSNRSS